MTLEDFKTKLIDKTMNTWENTTEYRWSDVFDYICDYWNLDDEWENLFEKAAKYIDKSFDECYYIALKEPSIFNDLVISLVNILENKFKESLKENL